MVFSLGNLFICRSNPANRVEVWNLSDVQDISNNRETSSRNDNNKSCTPLSSRAQSSPSPFNPPAKIVDGVPCLSLAFLHSTVNLKNKTGELYPELTYYLVVGLQVWLYWNVFVSKNELFLKSYCMS